jgi:AraC-like DNA-binding protein
MVLFCHGLNNGADIYIPVDLYEKMTDNELPVLYFDDDLFLYGATRNIEGYCVIWGPTAIKKITDEQKADYCKKYNIPEFDFAVQISSLNAITAGMAMIYSIFNETIIDENDILSQYEESAPDFKANIKSYVMYRVENKELGTGHLSNSTERIYLDMIRRGDTEALKNNFIGYTPNDIGRFANSSIKFYEYMVCASVTLACRAAIEGGAPPDSAYTMCDVYLQRLEVCKNIESMLAIHAEAKMSYAESAKIAQTQKSRNIHVEKCKTYILNNLNRHFSLDDLAKETGVNKTYLSRRFFHEEGIGIKQYTKLNRVQEAASLLKYSDLDISAIASYLCFSSQSHFGLVFKEVMKTTPQAYRTAEKMF